MREGNEGGGKGEGRGGQRVTVLPGQGAEDPSLPDGLGGLRLGLLVFFLSYCYDVVCRLVVLMDPLQPTDPLNTFMSSQPGRQTSFVVRISESTFASDGSWLRNRGHEAK